MKDKNHMIILISAEKTFEKIQQLLAMMLSKGNAHIVGENVNCCTYFRKQYGYSANPLLAIYPKRRKTLIQRYTCTSAFVAPYLQYPRYGSNISVHL